MNALNHLYKLSEIQTDECIIWDMGYFPDGYPQVRSTSSERRGNRIVLEKKLGRYIKEGYQALHTCDVPGCVNPRHLWEGTPKDNMVDKSAKGRCNTPRGDRHGSVTTPGYAVRGEKHYKSTPENTAFRKDAHIMALAILAGEPRSKIQRMYKVSKATLHRYAGKNVIDKLEVRNGQ